jgi:hypothetical protein
MGKFQGAVIKEQSVTFAIVVVKQSALQIQSESQKTAQAYVPFFPSLPIILMAQDSRGTPTYWGRKDIVNFFANVHISQIPWKEYTIGS